MIVINKQDISAHLHQCTVQHKQNLQALTKTVTNVDEYFAKQVFESLDTFILLIPAASINDVFAFNKAVDKARDIAIDFADFTEYAIDILSNAFTATNDLLSLHATLTNELIRALPIEKSFISVATDFITCNYIRNQSVWQLSNFKDMPGIGMNYDIHVYRNDLTTTILENYVQGEHSHLALTLESMRCLDELIMNPVCKDAIESWHATSRDLTYARNRAKTLLPIIWDMLSLPLHNLVFYKESRAMRCILELSMQNNTCVETLKLSNAQRVIKHKQASLSNILDFDYFNNMSFRICND